MSIAQGQFSHTLDHIMQDVAGQYWPESALYVVATPIGNLGDISPRALYALQLANVIACEDTRSSKTLLNAYGIHTSLMSAHQHNEAMAAEQICQRLAQGERVALISDAGAPAVSDPGAKIVAAVRAAGFQVCPISGASAVITALMGSGLSSDTEPGFIFAGFVPPKTLARQQWLKRWEKSEMTVIMFESPHRIVESVQEMAMVYGPDRPITLARELSKRFEQIVTLPAQALLAWLEEDKHRQKGEFVVLLGPVMALSHEEDQAVDPLLEAMLEHISLKDAVKIATKLTKLPKDKVYSRALALKEQSSV